MDGYHEIASCCRLGMLRRVVISILRGNKVIFFASMFVQAITTDDGPAS